MSPPKVLGVPVPSLTDSGKLRTQPQDPMRSTHRGASPSLSDSHDGTWDPAVLEEFRARLRVSEDRQASAEERIAALEARREPSSPPGTVELKSPGGWRGRAPPWLALVGMVFAGIYAASKVPRDVWSAIWRALTK